MIYVVISRENDGHYYDETFTNEKLAIQKYECDRNRTFCGRPRFNSVQLFILCKDCQEPGLYPIYKPIKKYVNGKWIKTKFYKKFMFDVDKYFR